MNRKQILLTICLLAIGAALLFLGSKANQPADNENVPPQSNTVPEQAEDLPAELVTKTGTVDCLSHKNTDGPRTLECAIGLKDDSGKSYALRSDDPTVVGSIPTGSKVEVTGILEKPDVTSKYAIEGTIAVTSIRQL